MKGNSLMLTEDNAIELKKYLYGLITDHELQRSSLMNIVVQVEESIVEGAIENINNLSYKEYVNAVKNYNRLNH